MGEQPHRFFTTPFWRTIDAVDCMTISGFAVLIGGVWLEFGTGFALIASGLGLMGLGVFAMRG